MATTISNQPQATTALPQSTSLKPTDDDLLRCPVEVAARIIGQKWTLQIVKTLLEEERVRFCELQDALGGVNPTTLSTRLKLLEENGIVCRTQVSDLPPHVEYSLTEMGQQLDEVLRAVVGWSRRWLCPG
ncbi:MAG: helix-turn-helix transcriptional regulator [Caldilineaceae bacterium]|nr:helix-turn-helix transcriptional regulator [Caldilineaceae bacterium]